MVVHCIDLQCILLYFQYLAFACTQSNWRTHKYSISNAECLVVWPIAFYCCSEIYLLDCITFEFHVIAVYLQTICRQFSVHLQCSPVKVSCICIVLVPCICIVLVPCICIVLVPCICTVLCICICTVHCNALHLHLHCTSDLHLFALSPFAAASALIARWRDPDWRRPSI